MKRNLVSVQEMIDYIEEIKISLKNDIEKAIDAYMDHFFKTNEGVGLFAIPRLIFPEIDNIASYYAGSTKNTPKNSIKFIKKYFSKVNIEYKYKGAFIYLIYRHGLMHQHIPKMMSYRRTDIGWAIGMESGSHLKLWGKTVKIGGRQFYKDFIMALDLYASDLKNSNLLQRKFLAAHKEITTSISKTDVLRRWGDYIKRSDLRFIK